MSGKQQHMETREHEGVHIPMRFDPSGMAALKKFDVRQDDAFIVTFPKAGTTWTQEIISCVLHDGDLDEVNKTHTMIRVPFLEWLMGSSVQIDDMPKPDELLASLPTSSPRLIKSHLPGQLLPSQVWEKKVKIVYVVRNPKDVVVSFFHHVDMLSPGRNFQFDEMYDAYMAGTCPYGNWWDHYLYFWERRNDDHVLFLRFEDMKKDLRGTVKKISEFLGKSLSDEILDAITDHCSFESMKKNPMTNPDSLIEMVIGGAIAEGKTFLRQGAVGNWKAHLSPTQSKALDDLCKEKFEGTGLSF